MALDRGFLYFYSFHHIVMIVSCDSSNLAVNVHCCSSVFVAASVDLSAIKCTRLHAQTIVVHHIPSRTFIHRAIRHPRQPTVTSKRLVFGQLQTKTGCEHNNCDSERALADTNAIETPH